MRSALLLLAALAAGNGCRAEGAAEPVEPTATANEPPPAAGDAAVDRAPGPLASARGPDLTPTMRELLRERMVRHGEDIARLQRVALGLEYELIEQTSAWLAQEPAVKRPRATDRELLRAGLPPRFFQLEAQMRGRAIELRGAALVRDDEAIAVAYGRLAETCIRCHALYGARAPSEPGK